MDWRDLDDLIAELDQAGNPPLLLRPDYGQIGQLCKDIHSSFRGVRYPTKYDRDQAWEQFCQIRTAIYDRRDREKAAAQSQSSFHRESIMRQIGSARPNFFDSPDPDLLKQYGANLSEAGRLLSALKERMVNDHKAECFDEIQNVRDELDRWWEILRKKRGEGAHQRRPSAEENLARNRERYRKTADALARTEAFIEDMESKIASAWNDKWADAAADKVQEARRRADDMRSSLDEIQGWIEQDEDRLR